MRNQQGNVIDFREPQTTETEQDERNEPKEIIVGMCAMSKKVLSRPMCEVRKRLQAFQHINVIIFDEETILKKPIVEWPICHALLSFYSDGFPLDKAIAYAKLRKPYLVNDLESQHELMDRSFIYAKLMEHDVPVPKHAVLKRDEKGRFLGKSLIIHENDDAIEVDGVTIHKPFVEKPLSAENHNINIYFPHSTGGGCVFLYRKTNNRSSSYMKEVNSVRKTGSYIYEEFMPTDGTDVKVYTVGDDYAHAEARKSPSLDGRVERDDEGKEVRYPVILTPREKIIAKKVCQLSRQQVCGFDLLRANGQSFVCDVNGFSLVKSSKKYYQDCGFLLSVLITRAVSPRQFVPLSRPLETPAMVPTTVGTKMELRTVIAVIRHGDRTPKQKLKMEVKHPSFFALFSKYEGYRTGELKLKKPKELQNLLDVCRSVLEDLGHVKNSEMEYTDNTLKLHQLRCILELYGHFSGLNRKVQFKLCEDSNGSHLLMVVKWGGELTDAGKQQAEKLGRAFRELYPESEAHFSKGMGLLRLHSTYRHDLKIYASEEGRVQATAAAFAKGLLALEGELTPILAQMVKSANTNGLLDCDADARSVQGQVKKKIAKVLSKNDTFTKKDFEALVPTQTKSSIIAMKVIMNPYRLCVWLQTLLEKLVSDLDVKRGLHEPSLYHNESWEIFRHRWSKLDKEFCRKDGSFDISKLPDIYDNIKYDLMHNSNVISYKEYQTLYQYAKHLADIVVPQEYGITMDEKLLIGQRICRPLMKKVLADAHYTDTEDCLTRLNSQYSKGVSSPGRFVRTRLYFTSESHIHGLVACLRYGGLTDDDQWKQAMEYVDAVTELNYLSQIVIMIYEDPRKSSKEKFHVEIHFSPGEISDFQDLTEMKTQSESEQSEFSSTDTRFGFMDTSPFEVENMRKSSRSFLSRHVGILSDQFTPAMWESNMHKVSEEEKYERTSSGVDEGTNASTPAISSNRCRLSPRSITSSKGHHRLTRNDSLTPVISAVSGVTPLRTLHNSLTLSQLQFFLDSVIQGDLLRNISVELKSGSPRSANTAS